MRRMWVRIASAAACFAAIMGFSRLAYGLLVPAMQASLGGGLDIYGLIGAGNLGGYFAGSLIAARLAALRHRSRLNGGALIAMCLAIAGSGFAHDLFTLGLLRFFIGVASGVALSLTLALAVEGVGQSIRGRAAALVWSGGTAGMSLVGAGAVIFPFGGDTWRYAWFAMALIGILAALIFSRVAQTEGRRAGAADDGVPIGLWSPRKYLFLAVGYTAFGFGYIDVVTFFGAALARTHAAGLGLAVLILGGAGTLGALCWGPLVDRFRSGVPIAAAGGLCAAGALMLSLRDSFPVLMGAFVFGIGFIGVPAMIGALAQQREPPQRYARAFALLTSTLGVGQVIGPFAGGMVARILGTTASLELGAFSLLLSAIFCGCYRRPRDNSLAKGRPNFAVM